MSHLAFILALTGVALLLVSALGLFRLPDALARQHAATKSGTLALWILLFSVALGSGDLGWWVRALLIVVLLLLTLPLASHMLARAAARESQAYGQVAEISCEEDAKTDNLH